MASAGFCYVPGGDNPSGMLFFGGLLAEKENEDVMYQQASPLDSHGTCQDYS